MGNTSRRAFIRSFLTSTTILATPSTLFGQEGTLTDLGGAILDLDEVTIFTAREIVTLDPDLPSAEAVAVVNGRILATGTIDQVQEAIGEQPFTVDDTFADYIIVPGFIAQHDHPVLGGLSLSSVILSIEDWDLPQGLSRAVVDKDDFLTRLSDAANAQAAPDTPVMTWGYHAAFYGPLTRNDLDQISSDRPIFVWSRSCHEFVLNSAAMEIAGITQEVMDAWSDSEKMQSSFENGHFWEQGLFAVLPLIAPYVATPEKFRSGLETMRDYLHAKGVTYGNEPGGILARPVQDAVNAIFSAPSMPFRWSFIPDGKSLIAKFDNDVEVIEQTEALVDWYGGKTSMAQGSVKLFADGAIYSLAIQLRDDPLGDYHGEWMMDLSAFERAFQTYWDAGYQVHVHVNGDAGLDRVLNALEKNLRRNPRFDHRTVIVHFAVSAPDQIDRIKRLGAIVSANPYYVTALADQYSKTGLGPARANEMVRLGDLDRAGVSWSLHSDMPMAPGDPLFLMWCAVNRVTSSGRVAGQDQTVPVEQALRGVTINAAYSHRLEQDLGSIEPGKRANFTILENNPLTVDPMGLKDIKVWGTVLEGDKFPVGDKAEQEDAGLPLNDPDNKREFAVNTLNHALSVVHAHL
ncbi:MULTISPECIES: amidohydrolase [unclassified Ruegeria]|uniref:amidohydrolase n=1 Tax=unclassified Ruegeria TaxID=2625375 RepID=UPI001487E1C5|nr:MULTISPECIES: amidohydrolase [unclassified Ruegeria]